MSYADLAAAAHLSLIDYLGDVPWSQDEAAKNWYARVKSRPSMRPLLLETLSRHAAVQDLRRSRLLTPSEAKAALVAAAEALGFDAVGGDAPVVLAAGARCALAASSTKDFTATWLAGGAAGAAQRSRA